MMRLLSIAKAVTLVYARLLPVCLNIVNTETIHLSNS
jgi:hypothetical protein